MKKGTSPGMEWNDAQIALLKREWAAGKTAAHIARLLGSRATRCAVIGKARRLGLSGRESPIKPGHAATNRKKLPETPSAMAKWWGTFWTPERAAIVRKGYNAATVMSLGEIALKVGCSAASIQRYAKENKLTHPHSSHRSRKSAWEKNAGRAAPAITAGERLADREPKIAPESRNVRLEEITRGQCHFPTSPHMAAPHQHVFCGAEVAQPGDRYCAWHHHVSVRKIAVANDDAPAAAAAE